jgi:MarR family transcriptional regulator, organic hydroperoxide resistance regulator
MMTASKPLPRRNPSPPKTGRNAPATKAAKPRPSVGFALPLTVSHPELLSAGHDDGFRETLYLMVLALGRLQTCREAFGRAMGLTGSQFAVLIGTAYQQKTNGVTIRTLADHVMLAPPHVTTEVGRLIRKGLLIKRPNRDDGRSVLVSLSARGEAALIGLAPFLRRVNDLLFQNVSRNEFEQVSKFFRVFALNTEYALAEIRRTESEHKSLKP